jgi:hypothetical protein
VTNAQQTNKPNKQRKEKYKLPRASGFQHKQNTKKGRTWHWHLKKKKKKPLAPQQKGEFF